MTSGAATRLAVAGVAAAGITALVTGVLLFSRDQGGGPPDAGMGPEALDAATIAPVSSRALDHAPSGCEIVARIDLARILATREGRIHLTPVVADVMTGAGAGARAASGLRGVLHAARIDLRKDVGDVVLCAGWLDGPPAERRIAVVAGGSMRPGTLLPALASARDGGTTIETIEGRPIARATTRAGMPLVVAQATDGAIAISSHGPYLEDALRTGAARSSGYQLRDGAHLALFVAGSVFAGPIVEGSPLGRHKDDVIDASASVAFEAPAGIAIRVETRNPDAARALAKTLGAMLEDARKVEPVDGGVGARWLEGGWVRVEGALVLAELPLDASRTEDLVKAAAGWLRGAYDDGFDL